MEYFTPYNEIDISSGIYQSCAHNDANVLESRGYMCNPEYEYLNPWRRVGADGVWNESGVSPPGFVPVYNCSELLENFPSAYEGWSALGYECRADGWWLAPPCAAKSPGDEWKDECIVTICYDPTYAPDVAPGVASLPAVAAAVSWFDVVDEYIYFWTSGHTTKNATPPTVLFAWWEPDASLNLWYGGHGQSYYYYYNSYYHDNYNLEGIDRRSQSYYPHEDIGGHNQSYYAYEDIGGHNQSYYHYEDIGGHNQSSFHNNDYNNYHYYYSRDVTEEVRPVNKTSIQFDARQQPIPGVPTTIAHETLYSLSPETASLLERFAIPSLDIHEMMTTVVEKFVEVGWSPKKCWVDTAAGFPQWRSN